MRPGRAVASSLLFCACACAPVLGCKDPARDETRSLVDAVSRFRLAGDGEKHARIGDIQRVACTAKDVCDTRDTCLRMAEELDHSLALRVQVNAGLLELKNGTMTKDEPRAQALYGILDESQASLEHSHALGKTCDQQISEITAHHR
jgi:hypothetical protein